MTRPTAVTAALAALALTAALAPAADGPAADDGPAAIRKLLDGQVADWNRGDLDGFLRGYWDDPGVVFQSGGDRLDGFAAVRDRYRNRYQAEGRPMGKLAFEGVEVVMLGADSAMARGRYRLTMPDGKTPGGLYTLILRRRPEGWRIIHDHTSAAAPPTPAAAAG